MQFTVCGQASSFRTDGSVSATYWRLQNIKIFFVIVYDNKGAFFSHLLY